MLQDLPQGPPCGVQSAAGYALHGRGEVYMCSCCARDGVRSPLRKPHGRCRQLRGHAPLSVPLDPAQERPPDPPPPALVVHMAVLRKSGAVRFSVTQSASHFFFSPQRLCRRSCILRRFNPPPAPCVASRAKWFWNLKRLFGRSPTPGDFARVSWALFYCCGCNPVPCCLVQKLWFGMCAQATNVKSAMPSH